MAKSNSEPLVVHLVGFGSQGSAWAQCLKASGWQVHVYLSKKGSSFERAVALGFQPHLLPDLPHFLTQVTQAQGADLTQPHLIAMLTPDSAISGIYGDFVAPVLAPVCLILAHGFAIYSGDLKVKHPDHRVALLAPKAIGPKILQHFQAAFPETHSLVAAYCAPFGEADFLFRLARGLGFKRSSLIEASFDQETIGDLISEQGLLCGGLFNLLDWTIEAMVDAGIPERLIHEECLSELELIVGLIRERGLAGTFQSISQVAQAGTIAMAGRLEESGLKKGFTSQIETIKNRKFVQFFHAQDWRGSAQKLKERLSHWENHLKEKS